MESLIIHLRDGASPQWMVCNSDGHVIVNAVSGELVQAATMSTGRKVVVILPAHEALVTESDAPAEVRGETGAGHSLRAGRTRCRRNREPAFRAGRSRSRTAVECRVVVIERERHRRTTRGTARRRAESPCRCIPKRFAAGDARSDDRALLDGDSLTLARRRCAAAGHAGAVHRRRLRDRARRPAGAGARPRGRPRPACSSTPATTSGRRTSTPSTPGATASPA